MTNLTLSVDEEVLRRARIRALEQGTSVNAILREALESYAGLRAEQLAAAEKVLSTASASASRRGARTWTRDELHERET